MSKIGNKPNDPNDPNKPGKPDKPDEPDKPDKPDKPKKPGKSGRFVFLRDEKFNSLLESERQLAQVNAVLETRRAELDSINDAMHGRDMIALFFRERYQSEISSGAHNNIPWYELAVTYMTRERAIHVNGLLRTLARLLIR